MRIKLYSWNSWGILVRYWRWLQGTRNGNTWL